MRKTIVAVALVLAGIAGPANAAEVPQGRSGVGDSIMLSASEELAALGYGVDAEVGRQFAAGIEVVRRKADHGKLPRIVVFHLGTNGSIPADGCERLLEAAGKRRIFMVTVKVPRSWEEPNNELIRACAASSERVHVIRWYAKASRHPEWFADDGYHVNAEGQAAFAALIDRVVDETIAARRSG